MSRGGYFGIDISGVSLQHAQKNHSELELGRDLKEFDGLSIPFPDGFFDKIVCFGVFDACSQELVLRELIRVLRGEGVLLLTGKNNSYFEDDEDAIIAEVNARKKGHPNYFTDVHSLLAQLEQDGIGIVDAYYFSRRGDFPANRYIKGIPDTFYEYALFLQKGMDTKGIEYMPFSSAHSLRGKARK